MTSALLNPLEAVWKSPDDDTPRLAYAASLPAGSPRRQVIEHQLSPAKPAKAREEQIQGLVAASWAQWVGAILPCVADEGVVFERGFLSRCIIGPKGPGAGSTGGMSYAKLRPGWEQAIGAGEWATVRAVRLDAKDEYTGPLLAHERMTGLREIENIGLPLLATLAGGDLCYAVERVATFAYKKDAFDSGVLAAARGLPSLRHLEIFLFDGLAGPPPWLAGSDLLAQLETVTVPVWLAMHDLQDSIPDWLRVASRANVHELRFGAPGHGWNAVFRRGDSGKLDRLSLEWHGKEKLKAKPILRLLETLAGATKITGTIEMSGRIALPSADEEALDAAAGKLGARLSIVPPVKARRDVRR
jgi:hypothetical protein